MSDLSFRSLADLARACKTLRPDDDITRRNIAALLGIAAPLDVGPEAALQPAGRDRHIRVADQGRAEVKAWEEPLPTTPGPSLRNAPMPEGREIPAVLTPDPTAWHIPDWLDRVLPLAKPPAVPIPPPLPDSLFRPEWTRAILSGSLSRPGYGGLDLDILAREVARRQPLLRLPRLPVPTLVHGVQILVDRGERMLPFAVDQTQLVEQIRTVAGRESVEVLFFDGFPGHGAGVGSRRLWRPYPEDSAPRRGAVVAVLTDLGAGAPVLWSRSGGSAEWLELAQRLGRLGSPLVVFMPYRPELAPADLRRAMTLLHWDRRTGAGDVRRALGRARHLQEAAHP